MATYTQEQLTNASNATYTTNGAGDITGATVRALNLDWISSSVLLPMTSSMTVLSSSYAATASLLLGTITTASLATTNLFTASVSTNVLTFTKGDGSTFNLTVDTGSTTPAVSTFPYTGSAIISGSLVITGSAYGNVVPVTVASNTASIDLSAGNFFTVTLGNNATTFFNVSNVRPGVTANVVVTTGTVSTASFSSNVKQPSGSFYLPTSGSGRIDNLSFAAVDVSNIYVVSSKWFI